MANIGANTGEILLTPAEAAGRLRVSRMTVYRLCESGHLDAVRIGPGEKMIRIKDDSVQQYMQKQQNKLWK